MPEANIDHTPSRRAFLGHVAGGAAVAAVAAGVSTISHAGPARHPGNPDAEESALCADSRIIEMGKTWTAINKELAQVEAEMQAIREQVRDACPPPDFTESNIYLTDVCRAANGEPRVGVTELVENIKKTLATNPGALCPGIPMKERLTMLEAWQQQANAAYARLGFLPLENRCDELIRMEGQMAMKIKACAAHTFAGVAVKLRVADSRLLFSAWQVENDWAWRLLGETLRQIESLAQMDQTSPYERLRFAVYRSVKGVEVRDVFGGLAAEAKRFKNGWGAKLPGPERRFGVKRFATPLEAVARLLDPGAHTALAAAFHNSLHMKEAA